MPASTVVPLLMTAALLAGCGSVSSGSRSAPGSPASATAALPSRTSDEYQPVAPKVGPCPSATQPGAGLGALIVDGRRYVEVSATRAYGDPVGPVISGQICSSGFLPRGTVLHADPGGAPGCRIAARIGSSIHVYQAVARAGDDPCAG